MVDILSDQQRQAEHLCNEGIELCEENNFPEAHQVFQRAYEMDAGNAKIQSWLGYTTGIVEKKIVKGLELCRKAIDSQIPDALFYRNMGKLYLLQNNKRAAIGAFSKGLQLDKTSRGILKEWMAMGFRRKQPVGFLDRSHWINLQLGKFTWWLKHRDKKI